jgi:glycosyltransferase involved in cell wall biosynthesis
MNATTPRVSIGLPVYNGSNFLAQSLDALLGQTFTDFELIISDNASTDETPEIIADYAARDHRIRSIRQPANIGGAPNQAFLATQARGEYFKYAAHDDLYSEVLLERCVEVLDRDPSVALCHGQMAFVDENNDLLHHYDYAMATDSWSAPERFRALLVTDGGDDEYGVIRTDVLRRVKPAGSYYHSGRPFVAEIALHGRFHQVPDLVFFRRDHPGRGDRSPSIPELCARLDPRRTGQSTARLVSEYVLAYVTAIQRAPISARDKAACLRHLTAWLGGRAVGRSRFGRPADYVLPGSTSAAAGTAP